MKGVGSARVSLKERHVSETTSRRARMAKSGVTVVAAMYGAPKAVYIVVVLWRDVPIATVIHTRISSNSVSRCQEGASIESASWCEFGSSWKRRGYKKYTLDRT